jgi:hypothetical protein
MTGPSLLHELRVNVVSLVSVRYISRSRSASYLTCYPHMDSQIPRIDFSHSHTYRQLFGTLDRRHIIQYFWGDIASMAVDFGNVSEIFYCKGTERAVLNSVAVRMDCEEK